MQTAPAEQVLFTGETSSVFGRLKGKAGKEIRTVQVKRTVDGKDVPWEVRSPSFLRRTPLSRRFGAAKRSGTSRREAPRSSGAAPPGTEKC
jgi:hypothetical protein